jgi:hypothetical protein
MLGSTASWLTFAPLFFQKRSGSSACLLSLARQERAIQYPAAFTSNRKR